MTKTAATLDEQISSLDSRIETLKALTNPDLRECPEHELHAAIDRKLTAETEIKKLLEERSELLRRQLARQQEEYRQQRLKEIQQTESQIETAHEQLAKLAAEFNELNQAVASKLKEIDELADKVRHLPNKAAVWQDEIDPQTNEWGTQQHREASPLVGDTKNFACLRMIRVELTHPGLPLWVIEKRHYMTL